MDAVSQPRARRALRFVLLIGIVSFFANSQLIAYHFQKADAIGEMWVPITYIVGAALWGLGMGVHESMP